MTSRLDEKRAMLQKKLYKKQDEFIPGLPKDEVALQEAVKALLTDFKHLLPQKTKRRFCPLLVGSIGRLISDEESIRYIDNAPDERHGNARIWAISYAYGCADALVEQDKKTSPVRAALVEENRMMRQELDQVQSEVTKSWFAVEMMKGMVEQSQREAKEVEHLRKEMSEMRVEMSSVRDEIKNVREEMSTMRECAICLQDESEFEAAVPCGHRFCVGCGTNLRVCAVCRTPIHHHLRLY